MAKAMCRNAYRPRGFPQIICLRLLDKELEPGMTPAEMARYMCAHQYYCPVTCEWENTDAYRQCPKNKR